MSLSEIFQAIARLFGHTASHATTAAVPVASATPAAIAAIAPAPAAPQPAAPIEQSVPAGAAPVVQMAPVTTHPSPTWLDLCLPVTKHFETCQLVAYCDPASPRGRAIAKAGLWYAYLRDRSIGERAVYASLDPKPWTCGWGSTGADITQATRWSQDQADTRLVRQLTGAAATVDRNVKVSIDIAQKAALTDFVFNEGAGNFATSTLLHRLNASDFVGAAGEFAKWDLAGGQALDGLEARRMAEKQLFTTGEWQP